jgi:uncharacterized protein YjbI with pentapeptide repeats
MANPEHLEILKQGVNVWNKWRKGNPKILPDLSNISLKDANLINANLSHSNLRAASLLSARLNDAQINSAHLYKANLQHANFSYANLSHSCLDEAELSNANLSNANLGFADLSNANLSHATLIYADLRNTELSNANLSYAQLYYADFSYASLRHVNLNHTIICGTKFNNADLSFMNFADMDLREAVGLETVRHHGPSEVGINTIYLSQGTIPEIFLRGCGVPESFIVQMHDLVVASRSIEFYSCFISYSTKDEDFARHLFSRMQEANLRVWYAPEEIKGGQKLNEQIYSAIQTHDKLLLVLSENSLQSEWVATEMRRARKVEREENRRKLFPIRLVDFDAILKWECFDADSGKDLSIELREYFIPDFSNWKDYNSFEKAFDRLLRDLKAEEKKT